LVLAGRKLHPSQQGPVSHGQQSSGQFETVSPHSGLQVPLPQVSEVQGSTQAASKVHSVSPGTHFSFMVQSS